MLAVDDVAARALGAVVAERVAVLELSYVPDGAIALAAFADALRAAGMRVLVEPLIVAPRLTLPATFDTYLASLGGTERHELRRKIRRLEAEGRIVFEFVSHPERGDALDRFISWHRATPGEKGTFLTPEREAFFRALAREGGNAGWCRIAELRLDGAPIAALFAFEIDGVLSAYNSAVAPGRGILSPGVLLHAFAIRDAIARGLAAYDFLRGDERYKHDLGGRDVQLRRLHAERTA